MAKGKRTITVEGNEIELRFSFGAVEDFCEELDITFSGWQQEVFDNPKNMRILVYHMAKDSSKDLKPEDLREANFFDIANVVKDVIEEASQGNKKKAGKRGKK